ncbi:MAG: helicase HerA-like domain-containing protein, partial [Parvibaculum sedimenti]
PSGRVGPATDAERQAIIAASPMRGRYDHPIDRESAYEMLQERAERDGAPEKGGAASSTSVPRSGPWDNEPAEPRTPTRAPAREPRRTASTTERVITNVASSAARSIGTQIGRAIFRSILGSMTKR